MFRATVDGADLEGKPITWTSQQMVLLARDGQLHYFDPRQASGAKKTAPRFAGFATSEMRSALRQEFGNRYEVTSTGHYLVVHPQGMGAVWGERFEQLFRAFHGYFRVRGFDPDPVEFPLVAVVYPNRDIYYREAQRSGARLMPNTLGHYDPDTNRVLMYDPAGDASGGDWEEASLTIVHEATHQIAYNVGLHNRTADTPRWLVEGLAMLFEAPGVYHSEAFGDRRDRINRERLDDFRHFQDQGLGDRPLVGLVASDQPFRVDGRRAYASAWALTFYLSETRPRQYEQYLTLTARRTPLVAYKPADRLADFRHSFDDDLEILEANFVQWVGELR